MSTQDAEVAKERRKLAPSDPRVLVEAKSQEASLDTEWRLLGENLAIRVGFPNGREKRWRSLNSRLASQYADLKFDFTFLGEHDAVLFRESGVIEASINYRTRSEVRIEMIPGARRVGGIQLELAAEGESGPDAEDIELPAGVDEIGRSDAWVLPFTSTDVRSNLQIEIGSATEDFTTLSEYAFLSGAARYGERLENRMGRFPTIRIKGTSASRHDEALELLDRISDSVFFEFDLHYGVSLKLLHSPSMRRARNNSSKIQSTAIKVPPRNPQNSYLKDPLALYQYGRSSSGIPLLEYLAYYQVLEYFFPSFSHKATLEKLRNELLDPRFQADDTSNLVRILNLASGAGKGYGSEREQLRATIAGCVTEEQIREFIQSDEVLAQHFSGKQKIKGAALINLADSKNDLVTAVANRAYDIRCRIVHTKEEAGGASVELLLPFSREAEMLRPDIELIKYIAQKSLISGASRLHV
ncbi:hypothetical protein ACFYYM_32150 [Streptomyces erythrochromogenes]|uniref:hypothetical protein n=1 Tax=Streptomyces erythrochromogenes TaxID=285574 RepID=UPI0036925787